MNTPDSQLNSAAHRALHELRHRAELRKNLVTQALNGSLPLDVQRLVQNLQGQQLELEMQYEKLLLAQAELEAAREQYVDLYDFAPVSHFSLDASGHIRQLNLKAGELLNIERRHLVGRRFAWFIATECRVAFHQFFSQVLATGQRQTLEVTMQREGEASFFALLEGVWVVPTGPGGSAQCRLVVLDITQQQQAKLVLAASEDRFRKLFAQSADAVVLVRNRYFLDCNASALRLLAATDRDEVVGQHVTRFFPEFQPDGNNTSEMFACLIAKAEHEGSGRLEALMHRITGEEIWVEAVVTPFMTNGQLDLLHVVWRDITAAREAQAALLRQKDFCESLLDNSVDGILAFDAELRLTAWNRVQEAFDGRPEAEVVGQHLLELFPEYAGGETEAALRTVLRGQRAMRLDMPFHHCPGYFESYFVPLASPDGTLGGGLVHVRDLTERIRLAEEATGLKLRQQQEVLAAILTTQEEERKRIAEALHNGVGQLLYAAKLNLENRSHEASYREAALSLIDEAIRTTRSISHELTPGILEDFGLKIALEELVKRIPKQQLHAQLHLHGLEQPRPRLYDVATYRIVQELLSNIIRHAEAQEAFIHVVHENQLLHISAEDNGQGFRPPHGEASAKGIGLAGIRNRLDLLGGTFAIDSRPGQGAIITIEIPVKQ